jgi:hypothetical protein
MLSKVAAYTCLILLLFNMVRPAIPILEYGLRKEYIVKYLCENRNKPGCCCQGKCYLNKQLARQNQSTDADSRGNERKFQNNDLKEYLLRIVSVPVRASAPAPKKYEPSILYSYNPVPSIFVPPWALR